MIYTSDVPSLACIFYIALNSPICDHLHNLPLLHQRLLLHLSATFEAFYIGRRVRRGGELKCSWFGKKVCFFGGWCSEFQLSLSVFRTTPPTFPCTSWIGLLPAFYAYCQSFVDFESEYGVVGVQETTGVTLLVHFLFVFSIVFVPREMKNPPRFLLFLIDLGQVRHNFFISKT